MMRNLRTAFGLLTTLPVGISEPWQPGDSGRAAFWVPLVGLAVGGLVWLAWLGLNLIFPALVAAVLTLAVWVGLTGGLHLDGLADCCDGLPGSASRERRLEIMKDPHLGAFGVIGLFFVLTLKATALSLLAPSSGLSIVFAATLGRWLILPASRLPQARPGGMGADFAAGVRPAGVWITAALPISLAVLLGMQGAFAVLAALISGAALLSLAWKRIGGVTGDVLGALVEVAETVILLSFVFRTRGCNPLF
ncbi:MAG: adenosylcobinamide-GDP ribazoletransferase [Smithellaceae bacterium]|nr:adenosylcobinamide-GDP ribazoletransferase [Smithellaceae bacterium]